MLHDANKVYVRYCDGGYWSGDRKHPIKYDGKDIYFHGRFITEALVHDLSTKWGLENATDVVMSGCSAGGIHVFAHIDHWAHMVRTFATKARVVGFADSGFDMDIHMFTSLKKYVVDSTGQNATAMLSRSCLKRHSNEKEKCLIASVLVSDIQTPVFGWQSEFDSDQRDCEMTPRCAANEECVNGYGKNLTNAVMKWLLGDSARGHGVFLDSCSRHCARNGPEWQKGTIGETVDGMTPLQALDLWYRGVHGGRKLWRQGKIFPCTDCCGK